jgi:hypothetical protein
MEKAPFQSIARHFLLMPIRPWRLNTCVFSLAQAGINATQEQYPPPWIGERGIPDALLFQFQEERSPLLFSGNNAEPNTLG